MKNHAALFISIFLVSCTPIENKLCKENKFYCEDVWESKLESLSNSDLLDVMDSYYKVKGAGNTEILSEIKKRNDLISLIEYRAVNGDLLEFSDPYDIIISFDRVSKSKICKENHSKLFAESFADSTRAQPALNAFCLTKGS